MKVLVTGAGGVIGRAVVRGLAGSGIDVTGIVSPRSAEYTTLMRRLNLAAPNLSLTTEIRFVPDAVVHLAAAVPDGVTTRDDERSADLTRRMDDTIANACMEWVCPCVYASGCSLYDASDPTYKTESSSVGAQGPYLASKLRGERVFLSEPAHCVLRISAPVGPGLKRGSVLGLFLERALRGEVIEVWGEGSREQDYVSALDIAECVRLVLEQRASGVYNAANGSPTKMRDLADLVVSTVGSGSWQMTGRPDPKERRYARFSVVKALEELGWRRRLDLASMIRHVARDELA